MLRSLMISKIDNIFSQWKWLPEMLFRSFWKTYHQLWNKCFFYFDNEYELRFLIQKQQKRQLRSINTVAAMVQNGSFTANHDWYFFSLSNGLCTRSCYRMIFSVCLSTDILVSKKENIKCFCFFSIHLCWTNSKRNYRILQWIYVVIASSINHLTNDVFFENLETEEEKLATFSLLINI